MTKEQIDKLIETGFPLVEVAQDKEHHSDIFNSTLNGLIKHEGKVYRLPETGELIELLRSLVYRQSRDLILHHHRDKEYARWEASAGTGVERISLFANHLNDVVIEMWLKLHETK